jgi:hypothetical protein
MICKTDNRIWTPCVCVYASATLYTWFVIIATPWCCKFIFGLLVKCNVWCVMLNDAILVLSELVWNPSWFRLTTWIIWAQVWKFERFSACFCTCALIIWLVLLHPAPSTNQVESRGSCLHYHWGSILIVDQGWFNSTTDIPRKGLYKQGSLAWEKP